jgi:ubiquinone/menaquinone biosynthesis C-methylase UbiE
VTVNQPASGQPKATTIDADAFSAFESAGWHHQAPTYDKFMGRLTSRFVDPLLDAASVGPGMRVLDLATGPGYAAAKAAERGAAVVGVDFAPAMIELARQLHPGLEFRAADAEDLPFADGSFDAVISNFVVPHLGRHREVVIELARVLRDGGTLALTTWDMPDRMRLLGIFLDAFAAAGATAPEDIPVGPPFFRFADDAEFRALLVNNGLTAVEVATIAVTEHVSTADELWDGMLSGTVRTSGFFLRQPEDIQRRVRSAFDGLILEYQRGDEFELPVSVKLAYGRKIE